MWSCTEKPQGKHAVLGNESGADQRKSMTFHDPPAASCALQVCLHMHLEKSQVDLGNAIFLSLLQANVHRKNLWLLIYHTAIRQDSQNWDASSTLASGAGWCHPWGGTSWAPPVPRPVICIPLQCPPLLFFYLFIFLPSAFTLMDNFILHIWVLHRDCLWAICCSSNWKSSSSKKVILE